MLSRMKRRSKRRRIELTAADASRSFLTSMESLSEAAIQVEPPGNEVR